MLELESEPIRPSSHNLVFSQAPSIGETPLTERQDHPQVDDDWTPRRRSEMMSRALIGTVSPSQVPESGVVLLNMLETPLSRRHRLVRENTLARVSIGGIPEAGASMTGS